MGPVLIDDIICHCCLGFVCPRCPALCAEGQLLHRLESLCYRLLFPPGQKLSRQVFPRHDFIAWIQSIDELPEPSVPNNAQWLYVHYANPLSSAMLNGCMFIARTLCPLQCSMAVCSLREPSVLCNAQWLYVHYANPLSSTMLNGCMFITRTLCPLQCSMAVCSLREPSVLCNAQWLYVHYANPLPSTMLNGCMFITRTICPLQCSMVARS